MAKDNRTVAEAKYAKAQLRAREAAEVMSEVAAEEKRVADNTARLRALRLARDAREAEERAANPPQPKKKKPAAKAKSISVKKLNAANDG
jgi:hypothetical protein